MQKSIGMVEYNSIARGIYASDQMVKVSEVEIVIANPVCPGKYITIVHGDVAAVQTSVETGARCAGEYLVDSIVIPNVHPDVFPAIVRALGIIESYSLSAMVIASDLILKSAELEPIELRLGTGLGGKAFFTFTGDVAAVQNGINVGKEAIGEKGLLNNAEVIPSPSALLLDSLF